MHSDSVLPDSIRLTAPVPPPKMKWSQSNRKRGATTLFEPATDRRSLVSNNV